MPTNADVVDLLVDTSVAVPFVVEDHGHHRSVFARNLLDRLSELGIAGGSVYDALVAATAVEHGAVLATRDRRALDTYRALGVDLELIGNNP